MKEKSLKNLHGVVLEVNTGRGLPGGRVSPLKGTFGMANEGMGKGHLFTSTFPSPQEIH